MLSSHLGFRNHSPFGRRSPFFVDMPALVDALCDVEHDEHNAHSGRRAILLDVKETDAAVEIRADIPGVSKEEINVDLDKNVLTLRVAHEEKKEESDAADAKDGAATWHRSERSRMFVKRSIRLPEATDTAAGSASYESGVLAIKFPKKALANAPIKLAIK